MFFGAQSEAVAEDVTDNSVFFIFVLYFIDFEFAVLCFLLLCPRQ